MEQRVNRSSSINSSFSLCLPSANDNSSFMTGRKIHGSKNPLSLISSTSLDFAFDPFPLLLNQISSSTSFDIHFVVHGSAGGVIHPIILRFVEEVRLLRQTKVQVEALTATHPLKSTSNFVLIIPLLLLPGMHVCHDIPVIQRRLNNQGTKTILLPFIGSWSIWIYLLEQFAFINSRSSPTALVHHPIRNLRGRLYLSFLKKRLQIPIISWNNWQGFDSASKKQYSSIPLALAPNRNTKSFCRQDSISSLLEFEPLRLHLINFFRLLP